MIRTLAASEYKWIDILSPTPEELNEIARDYNIHEALVADVLQPEHLPKYERVGETSFYILRYFAPRKGIDADTIQGLTNKIAVFQTEEVVITIHLFEIAFIDELKKSLVDSNQCKGTFHLLNRLIKAVFLSFEAPALLLAQEIDELESQVFLKKDALPLEMAYHVKRKIEVSKRVLILSKDLLEQIDDAAHQDPNTRDTRDVYVRILTLYESMSENTNNLLTLHFSISAQRTNEVIRVLTLFSVFFMPLTFIVGIYGMNFSWMPELRVWFGYPAVMMLMVFITVVIYVWFKRKHWI
jgi:magnesium transporter